MPRKTEETSADREQKISNRLRAAAIAIAVISLTACSILTIIEYLTIDQQEKQEVGLIKQKSPTIEQRVPPANGVLRLLPDSIDGFNTQARQRVPGDEEFSAEAIYETTKEELFAPHNSYVKATYYDNQKKALDVINGNLKNRYPANLARTYRNNIDVYTGYESNLASFYIAFIVDKKYLIEINTSFLEAIPADKGTILEDTAWGVFNGVSKQATTQLDH